MALSLAALGVLGGITAAGSLASGALSWGANAQLQNDAQQFAANQNQLNRDFSASENEKARAFNERMSSTQYQRAMKDLEAAGINPNAVFGSGGGASAPTGSAVGASSNSASSGHVSFPDLFNSALVAAVAKDSNFTDILSNALKSNARKIHDNGGFEEL